MTRTTRHHLTSTAIALASVLLVAGCTGDDGEPEASSSELPLPASVTASPSDEPSPTASPSPSGAEKPERPAAMDKKDGDGAAAAAEYFLGLRAYIMRTGDTADWKAMSHRACGFCDSGAEQADGIAARGDAYSGGEANIAIDNVADRDPVTGIFPVELTISEQASSVVNTDGEEIFSAGASTTSLHVEVALRDNQWVIVGVSSAK